MPDPRNSTDTMNQEDKAATELLNKLRGDNKVMMTFMFRQFKELKQEFTQAMAAKNTEIDELKAQVSALKKTVSKLEGTIDDQDAYERRDTIIISGNSLPEATRGEISSNVVCQVLKDRLKVELPPNEISTAHRLGKKPPTQTPDKRPFIIKLCRRDTKRTLLQAARSQNSSSPIYINESLTPKRRTILFALRQMKKAHPQLVTGCTSTDGKIFAFTKNPAGGNDSRHLVNTHEDLVFFCREYVKLPLDSFLDNWSH